MKAAFFIGLALVVTAVKSDADGVKCFLGCIGLCAMFFSPLFDKE